MCMCARCLCISSREMRVFVCVQWPATPLDCLGASNVGAEVLVVREYKRGPARAPRMMLATTSRHINPYKIQTPSVRISFPVSFLPHLSLSHPPLIPPSPPTPHRRSLRRPPPPSSSAVAWLPCRGTSLPRPPPPAASSAMAFLSLRRQDPGIWLWCLCGLILEAVMRPRA